MELTTLALRAARAGGEAVLAVTADAPVSYKGGRAADPVTAADHASEAAVRRLILAHRPRDGWLGEESGATIGTSGLRWVVDPLDGTVNFSRRWSRYAVSVAVETERDGRAVAAAIVLPATGGWLASGSAGPRGDAARIGVSDPPPERALLGFAVPGAPGPRRAAYRLLADIAPHVQDLRNSGSTVCDLAAVATGELDGFLSVNPAAWDVAAGAAIVRASGGTVRRWRRQDGLDLFVAGGRRLVDAIDELIGT